MIFGLSNQERRGRDERWTRRFAFLPVELFDGRSIWLEHYFVRISRSAPSGGPGILLKRTAQRFREIPTPVDQSWRENPPAKE